MRENPHGIVSYDCVSHPKHRYYSRRTHPFYKFIINMCFPCWPYVDMELEDPPRKKKGRKKHAHDRSGYGHCHPVSTIFFPACCLLHAASSSSRDTLHPHRFSFLSSLSHPSSSFRQPTVASTRNSSRCKSFSLNFLSSHQTLKLLVSRLSDGWQKWYWFATPSRSVPPLSYVCMANLRLRLCPSIFVSLCF